MADHDESLSEAYRKIADQSSESERPRTLYLADCFSRQTERSKLPNTTGAERFKLAKKRKKMLSD